MATRARLQRRLEARNKKIGNSNDATLAAIPEEQEYYLGMSDAEVDAAEDSGKSLVEEFCSQPSRANDLTRHFPKSWSLHRIITVYSVCPLLENQWRQLVSMFGLRGYYQDRELEILKAWDTSRAESQVALLQHRNALELAKISIADRVLMRIVGHLSGWDCLGLANRVCRRWHFVARCVWNRMRTIQLVQKGHGVPAFGLIRTSKFVYRLLLLTSITISGGISVVVNGLAKAFEYKHYPPVDTMRFGDVTFVSTRGSLDDANDQVCKLLRSRASLKVRDYITQKARRRKVYRFSLYYDRQSNQTNLVAFEPKTTFFSLLPNHPHRGANVIEYLLIIQFHCPELVIVDTEVCVLDAARGVRESCSLDLWYFEFTHAKSDEPLPLDNIQLSVKTLQRFTDNFKIFCKQVLQCNVKAIICCGAVTTNHTAGLSESSFIQGLALLMPHLREISLCNLSFADGNRLGAVSLDLLAKQIRPNSNLELFCLTNGEISEEAIGNLQRCAKLQILILLRCSITSKYPDLPLMKSWHPIANLPSSLITDDVIVQRWFRPTYFRVVRIDNFTDFSKDKFVNLRKRWWTIQALLKSTELSLPDFCFTSLIMNLEPEEIIADAAWMFQYWPAALFCSPGSIAE